MTASQVLLDAVGWDAATDTSGPDVRLGLVSGPLVGTVTLGSTGSPTSVSIGLHGEVTLSGIGADGTGKVACVKSDATIGTCTSTVGAGGTCTCS
ncbi:MAG: hypothetical protein IT180_10785 [Acidobacteria bacterium]|nr:hypothetical protein [Acidobacteriota bacterium]